MLTLILDSALDTSTAIVADGSRIILRSSRQGKALKCLHTIIHGIIHERSMHISEIKKIGVIQGPGYWTGLHVAMATAKALAQVYNLPVVPISFIDAIVFSSKYQKENEFIVGICTLLKGNIFFRTYEVNNRTSRPMDEHQTTTLMELIQFLKDQKRPIRIIGLITQEIISQIEFSEIKDITFEYVSYPSEQVMTDMVNAAPCVDIDFQDAIFLEPLYMEPSQELKLFKHRV